MMVSSIPGTWYNFRCALYVTWYLVYFSVAWKGELLADMSAAVSNSSVSCPHVLAHKTRLPPSLSRFYCTNSRTAATPDGPTPSYSFEKNAWSNYPPLTKIKKASAYNNAYQVLVIFVDVYPLTIEREQVGERGGITGYLAERPLPSFEQQRCLFE